MFRYKSSIPLSYERQGYIYFTSRRYRELTMGQQQQIRQLCDWVGGYHSQALLEHVTTGESVKSVCSRHYIASPTSLYRALKRYYMKFPAQL